MVNPSLGLTKVYNYVIVSYCGSTTVATGGTHPLLHVKPSRFYPSRPDRKAYRYNFFIKSSYLALSKVTCDGFGGRHAEIGGTMTCDLCL